MSIGMVRIGLLIVLLPFFYACDPRPSSPPSPPSPLQPSNLTPSGSLSFTYPHAENYKQPELHGKEVADFGMTTCLKCHSETTKFYKKGPDCLSCHPLYPHEEKWVEAEKHGPFVRQNGEKQCATACHGTDFTGGLSQVSCVKCHETYPHPKNWKEKNMHGTHVLLNGKISCANSCHGDDLSGGSSQKACNSCHKNYPHTPDWKKIQNHGLAAIHQTTEECQKCHNLDNDSLTDSKSCHRCHENYPHEEKWVEPEKHGLFARQVGESECATACHGSDLKGGLSIVSCNKCHESYPHPGNWKEKAQHGAYVLANSKLECANSCHGDDFSGGSSQKACNSCHKDYPHPETTWANLTEGTDKNIHGKTFKEKIKVGKTDDCTKCHGTMHDHYAELWKDCKSCHGQLFGHPAGVDLATWRESEHGRHFISQGNHSTTAETMDACWQCHGSPVAFKTTDTKDSLKNRSDCYACHPAYPHLGSSDTREVWPCVNLVGGKAHIDYVKSPPSSVWTAGQPFVLMESGCGGKTTQCHTNGARSGGSFEWDYPSGHSEQGGAFYCYECHDSDFSRPGCYDCHSESAALLPFPEWERNCSYVVPPAADQTRPDRPLVISVTPRNGTEEIPFEDNSAPFFVQLTFNEAINEATVNTSNIFLKKEGDTTLILPDSISCGLNWCRTASVGFAKSKFVRGATYSIHVSEGVTDYSGQPLQAFRSEFTTSRTGLQHILAIDYGRTTPAPDQTFSSANIPIGVRVYGKDALGPYKISTLLSWLEASVRAADSTTAYKYKLLGENCNSATFECESVAFQFSDPFPGQTQRLTPLPGKTYIVRIPNLSDKHGDKLVTGFCSDDPANDYNCYYEGDCPPCYTEWNFSISNP